LIAIFEENIIQLQHELGETGEELGATQWEAEPAAMTTDKRRKELVGSSRMSPKNPVPGVTTEQPPLEMYMVP
jgi:hypothetical protein